MIQILLNGAPIQIKAERSLFDFLTTHFGQNLKGVAVAINGNLARRSTWKETMIQNEDELEVLHAVAGG